MQDGKKAGLKTTDSTPDKKTKPKPTYDREAWEGPDTWGDPAIEFDEQGDRDEFR